MAEAWATPPSSRRHWRRRFSIGAMRTRVRAHSGPRIRITGRPGSSAAPVTAGSCRSTSSSWCWGCRGGWSSGCVRSLPCTPGLRKSTQGTAPRLALLAIPGLDPARVDAFLAERDQWFSETDSSAGAGAGPVRLPLHLLAGAERYLSRARARVYTILAEGRDRWRCRRLPASGGPNQRQLQLAYSIPHARLGRRADRGAGATPARPITTDPPRLSPHRTDTQAHVETLL